MKKLSWSLSGAPLFLGLILPRDHSKQAFPPTSVSMTLTTASYPCGADTNVQSPTLALFELLAAFGGMKPPSTPGLPAHDAFLGLPLPPWLFPQNLLLVPCYLPD